MWHGEASFSAWEYLAQHPRDLRRRTPQVGIAYGINDYRSVSACHNTSSTRWLGSLPSVAAWAFTASIRA
jgi:hypothetical protein